MAGPMAGPWVHPALALTSQPVWVGRVYGSYGVHVIRRLYVTAAYVIRPVTPKSPRVRYPHLPTDISAVHGGIDGGM